MRCNVVICLVCGILIFHKRIHCVLNTHRNTDIQTREGKESNKESGGGERKNTFGLEMLLLRLDV